MSIQVTSLPRAAKKDTSIVYKRASETSVTPLYMHLAWSDDKKGTGFVLSNRDSDNHIVKYKYLGIAINKTEDDRMMKKEDFIWTFVGCC